MTEHQNMFPAQVAKKTRNLKLDRACAHLVGLAGKTHLPHGGYCKWRARRCPRLRAWPHTRTV